MAYYETGNELLKFVKVHYHKVLKYLIRKSTLVGCEPLHFKTQLDEKGRT